MAKHDKLTFATQGGPQSYHAEAARRLAGVATVAGVNVESHDEFGEVVRAARKDYPGLGVIAYRTVAGTVEQSARSIIGRRTSALPPIVGRVDVPVKLALIGAQDQNLEALNRHGVRLLGQKPAVEQSRPWLEEHLPWIKAVYRSESTKAVEEAIARGDKNVIALGPTHAAKPMGGVVLGPEQINPKGSVTSFFALQRDPRFKLLPGNVEKTEKSTVVALLHPEGAGEMERIVDVAESLDIQGTRFTPFNPRTPTKHNPNIKRDGGILEILHGYYDEIVPEFCARVNAIKGGDGVDGPFDAKRLGEFDWYPGAAIDLRATLVPVPPEPPVEYAHHGSRFSVWFPSGPA